MRGLSRCDAARGALALCLGLIGCAGRAPLPAADPGQPPPVSAAPAALTPATAGGGLMFVQVGAFSECNNATDLVAQLQEEGFSSPIIVPDGSGRRWLYRVRLGPVGDVHDFDQINADLLRLGVGDAHLVIER